MKNTIIFEETWKNQHQVIIDFDGDDKNYLDKVLDSVKYTQNLDEALYKLQKAGVNIITVNHGYYEDDDGCNIYDVYDTPDEELE